MRRSAARSIRLLLLVSAPVFAADPALATAAENAARGDCGAAERHVRAYFQKKSAPNGDAYRLVADCYARAAQIEKAKALLREGIAALPASAVLQRGLGELLFRDDPKSGEAGELLRRASHAMPADPEAAHYYAQWAYMNRQDEICVRKEQAALRTAGLNDLALLQMYTLLGMCRSRLDDLDGAGASFVKARAVNLKRPSYDPMATQQYVQLLNRMGREREAMEMVEEILQRVPSFGPAHLERAKRLERERRPADAIVEARTALEGQGNDPETERAAHGMLARCYFATGDLAAAEREQLWIREHPNPDARR